MGEENQKSSFVAEAEEEEEQEEEEENPSLPQGAMTRLSLSDGTRRKQLNQ